MSEPMKTGKRNAALVELVLVILFFALSSMILVQVFVKARIMSQTSQAETRGLVFVQDIIEQWKADPSHPELLFPRENGWIQGNDSTEEIRIFHAACGSDMQTLVDGSDNDAAYHSRVKLTEETKESGILYRIQITVLSNHDGKTITDISTAYYIPGEEAAQ